MHIVLRRLSTVSFCVLLSFSSPNDGTPNKQIRIMSQKSMAPAYSTVVCAQAAATSACMLGLYKLFPRAISQNKKLALVCAISLFGGQNLLSTKILAEYCHTILACERLSVPYAEALIETIQNYLTYTLISHIAYNHVSAILSQLSAPASTPVEIENTKTIIDTLTNAFKDDLYPIKKKIEQALCIYNLIEKNNQGQPIVCSELVGKQDQCIIIDEIHHLLGALAKYTKTTDSELKESALHHLEKMIAVWNQLAQSYYVQINYLNKRFTALMRFENFISSWTRLTLRPLKK